MMTKDDYLAYCREMGGALADQPFSEDFDTWVLRHEDTGKWFGIIMFHGGRWLVNLKCDPMEAELLRKLYEGVQPAYHMNKRCWNSVYFGSDVPNEELLRMTQNSFALTAKKLRARKRPQDE
ncbi:MAG: MmcQ/YjbR family DNA-binding protein [Oscillospiraceae bacterium]